jgi:hypothetical protein
VTARLPDPSRSRILLIGTSHHAHPDERLPDLPIVANNLADLAAVFTDPDLGGFDGDHCVVAPPDVGVPDLGNLLVEAAEQAEDLLLIYFSGHGLIDRRGDLHLALSGTRADRLRFTALPYETVREVCLDSRARSSVVIIDSCFSGRAIGTSMSDATRQLVNQLEVTGTCILTSAPPNSTALAVPGERHTAFTGRLLELLQNGAAPDDEALSVGEIYQRLRVRLRADGLPEPQHRATATADLVGLTRNRGHLKARRNASGPIPATGEPSVTFSPTVATVYGQQVHAIGSIPALGAWDTAKAIALSPADYPAWGGTIALPPNTTFEYKYFKTNPDDSIEWESGGNRTHTTGAQGSVTLHDTWNDTPGTVRVSVTFHATRTTVTGQNVHVAGDLSELGGWDPARAVPLSPAGYPVWSGAVPIPRSTTFEYKYLVKDEAGTVTWEDGSNRSADSGTGATLTLNDTWR